MGSSTQYVAHVADHEGYINWSNQEHDTWHQLVTRQSPELTTRACDEYLIGARKLELPTDHVPQLPDIDRVLKSSTGWQTEAVPALINFTTFFELLSQRRFPVATFIRTPEEMDYLQEPDIFHEIFGHCPLLTNESFARFTETYGQLGLAASKEDRVYLARLYWFTVEFGIMQKKDGERKIYGGGILSSPRETKYAISGEQAEHVAFDLMTVLRTPYRIDILQPVYFYLDHIDQLFDIAKQDIMGVVEQAKKIGLLPAKFPIKQKIKREDS